MNVTWEEGFSISARVENDAMVVAANAAGLRSLANICLALAHEDRGAHIHLDEFNALEDGSTELIIERVPEAGNEVSR